MATGTITRREIIEDEALNWGKEYEDNLKRAIAMNKQFVDLILQLASANETLRKSLNQKDFQASMKRTIELAEEANVVWKEQNQLELQLISTKKKNELATEGTNRALAKERILLQETNKQVKQQAREQLGMVGSYERLNRARLDAQKRLAELMSAEKKNVIEIAAARREFDKLDTRIKAVDESIKNYSKNIGNYKSAFAGFGPLAKNLLSVFGIATGFELIGNVFKDVFQNIREFDRQLIAVGKTTDTRGEDLKKFGQEVIDLGQRLDGVTIDGLLKSAEVAGQLGVKGTPNILKFSEAIEKLKLTSNIISDEQVGNFAKFIEVSSDSFENADRLASVITKLGNEYATTEAEVLSNATEIQKSVSVYETSAQGVLGLGAATSTLGSEAEISGTSIQKTFGIINTAITTGKGLEKILKLTGLTQKELSDQFNKDATGVFVKLVKGLNGAQKSGENLSVALADIGIEEARQFKVIGSLAANYETLEGAMAKAGEEYESNKALNVEVEAAAQSLDSLIGDLKDEWNAYTQNMNTASEGSAKIASVLRFLKNNLDTLITGFVKVGSVIAAYIIAMKGFTLLSNIWTASKIAMTQAELAFATATGIGRTKILAKVAAIQAETIATKEATLATEELNLATKASPWGIVLGLLAAVIAAYIAFNDEMSKSEILTSRVANSNALIAADAKFYAEESDKYRAQKFKEIEKDIALRKAQGENDKKLGDEEIARKKAYIEDEISAFNTKKALQEKDAEVAIKNSEKRIAQMAKERDAGTTTGRRRDELIDTLIPEEIDRKTIAEKALKEQRDLTVTERDRLNKLLQDLDEDAAVKTAAFKAEEDKKAKERRKKHLKDLYDQEKKALDDLFKLQQFRLQVNMDMDREIVDNEKASFEDRVDALVDYQQTYEAKIKEAAVNELKSLGKYNEEKGVFIRQLSNVEIEELIKTGNLKKGMTDEQKLVYEKYQRELTVSAKKGEDDRRKLIDGQVEVEKRKIDDQILNQDTKLQKSLQIENKIYREQLALAGNNHQLIEQAEEEHQARIFQIKKDAAMRGLKLQIDSLQHQLDENDKKEDADKISSKKRDEISNDLETAKREYDDMTTEHIEANAEKKAEVEKEFFSRVKDLAFDLKDALMDFANALFEVRIANIDTEIEKNNEYYNRLIELAGNDETQREALERERDRKNDKLEKKKRKIAHDQAVANKMVTLGTIAAQTAMASIAALAPPPVGLGPVFGHALLPFIIGLGAIQAATVLATPLPKYKDGREDGPEEFAVVGDGGRREVISKADGSNPMLTPATSTITKLKKGDRVHKSVEDYERFVRASILTSIHVEKGKLDDFQATQTFDMYNKALLDELKENTRAIRNQKQKIIINTPRVDIPHSIWASKNTKWS